MTAVEPAMLTASATTPTAPAIVTAPPTTPTPTPTPSLTENDLWLLNYYRSSEINGALFFGRVARIVRGPLQVDVTHHFADESNHAKYWTQTISDLGFEASVRRTSGYQDQYLEAAGMPVNLMEVMAITQVFEKRVIGQYHDHLRFEGTHPLVRRTIRRIMEDERWHVKYVRDALAAMAEKYGQERVDATLAHFTAADEEVYANTLAEYGERVAFLAQTRPIAAPIAEPAAKSVAEPVPTATIPPTELAATAPATGP